MGAARLGGFPDRELPDWWNDPERGPEKAFFGFRRPDLKRIVRAALDDEVL
jgi:hypothetical protein